MSKKISKLLLTLLLIIVTISSFSVCFAEVNGETTKAVTTSENEDTTTAQNTTSTEDEIYNGDLYLFDNDIVMDKLVDGNVFIFGSNVEVTGQVNGNLFVFANDLKFNECYVRYSIFACAKSVYYNGACNDLYVASSNLEMTYDSYVVRDVKAVSADVIFKAAVGRDVDLFCSTIDFGETGSTPVVYGNLRYSANSENTIPEGVMVGDGTVTYTKPSESNKNAAENAVGILVGFLTCIATVLVIYVLIKKFIPEFSEKLSNEKLSVLKLLKSFGIGLLVAILFAILFIILLMTAVGVKLAFILALLFATICLVSVPTLTIVITNALKPALKIEKASMFCLILVLVSIVLYGVTLIPFIGVALGFIINILSIGLLLTCLFKKEIIIKNQVNLSQSQVLENEEPININKNENNILSIIISIILVVAVILVFNIPNLIILTSSSDASNAAKDTIQEVSGQLQEATDAAQESLNKLIENQKK